MIRSGGLFQVRTGGTPVDQIVVVTRWYGGKHLGGDRFRHVQECVRVWMTVNAV